jgi:hypothetical protein
MVVLCAQTLHTKGRVNFMPPSNQPTIQIEINIEEEYKKYIENQNKNKKQEEHRVIVIDMNGDDMESFDISRVDDKTTFQM